MNLGSGFDVKLNYSKDVTVPGTIIGLTDDYDLNKVLAQFLAMNEHLIPGRLSYIEAVLHNYRKHYRKESEWKRQALSYRFLTHVYNHPGEPQALSQSTIHLERDTRVRKLMANSVDVLGITYERFCAVATSEVATWWYIFWVSVLLLNETALAEVWQDDLWRRNWDCYSGLRKYATDFNPAYPTSIAYTPLPRAALENFLTQRGLLHKKPQFFDVFHAGFLNKIYLRLNDVVYHGSEKVRDPEVWWLPHLLMVYSRRSFSTWEMLHPSSTWRRSISKPSLGRLLLVLAEARNTTMGPFARVPIIAGRAFGTTHSLLLARNRHDG